LAILLFDAKVLAEREVGAIAAATGDDLVVIHDDTVEVAQGWVFFYNSREFVETGDFRDALAGNGPIFVDRDGLVRILPTAIPWETAIRDV
jgi:Immunity protein 35